MVKYNFTRQQFEEIKSLLKRRLLESRDKQKNTRAKIRSLGFRISDYRYGFTDEDFQGLLNSGIININDKPLVKNVEKETIESLTIQNKPSNTLIKSLPPVVDENTKILVLGTMPSENSLENQQYYNNPKNQFWKIIFSIFNKEIIINNYDKKIHLLKQNKIGLWDVLKTCEREGSADANITNSTVNDFETFFKEHPKIDTVIFNGQDSYAYFRKFIKIDFNDTVLVQLNSTSSLNSHKTIDQKVEEWKRYLKKNAT